MPSVRNTKASEEARRSVTSCSKANEACSKNLTTKNAFEKDANNAVDDQADGETSPKQEQGSLNVAIYALAFVSFTQLLGYNFLLIFILPMAKHFGPILGTSFEDIMLWPYAIMNVVCGLLYSFVMDKRKISWVRTAGDAENAHTASYEKSKPHGFFGWFSFPKRWVLCCLCMVSVYLPCFTLAIIYKVKGLVVLAMVLLGIGNSWLQACGSGLCTSLKSDKAMAMWSLGNALSGAPAAILSILMAFVIKAEHVNNLMVGIYVLNAVVLLVCLLLLPCVFSKHPMLRHQMTYESDGTRGIKPPSNEVATKDIKALTGEPEEEHEDTQALLDSNANARNQIAVDDEHADSDNKKTSILTIFAEDWTMYTGMFVLFLSTFTVFPGIPAKIDAWEARFPLARDYTPAGAPNLSDDERDAIKGANGGSFIPILFSMFAIGDIVGRYLPNLYSPPRQLFFPLALLRFVVFDTLIVLQTVYHYHWAITFVVMFLLGASLGYLATQCFIQAGSRIEKVADRALVGPLLGNALTCGILAGCTFHVAVCQGVDKALS
ncbi:unnamed protein product [Amoebophrya sp. A25]|nr:unnamed protein product [Amoebophrya sp. A25]|eukprot:GSA25T00015921001.1